MSLAFKAGGESGREYLADGLQQAASKPRAQ